MWGVVGRIVANSHPSVICLSGSALLGRAQIPAEWSENGATTMQLLHEIGRRLGGDAQIRIAGGDDEQKKARVCVVIAFSRVVVS